MTGRNPGGLIHGTATHRRCDMSLVATVGRQPITLGDLLRESIEAIIFKFNRECGHGTELCQPRQQT